jgi:hypothetical protein
MVVEGFKMSRPAPRHDLKRCKSVEVLWRSCGDVQRGVEKGPDFKVFIRLFRETLWCCCGLGSLAEFTTSGNLLSDWPRTLIFLFRLTSFSAENLSSFVVTSLGTVAIEVF